MIFKKLCKHNNKSVRQRQWIRIKKVQSTRNTDNDKGTGCLGC